MQDHASIAPRDTSTRQVEDEEEVKIERRQEDGPQTANVPDDSITSRKSVRRSIVGRTRLRRMMEDNRESLSKRKEKKELTTCVICMDDVDVLTATKLDACSHQYCHPCIKKWVDEVENTCP